MPDRHLAILRQSFKPGSTASVNTSWHQSLATAELGRSNEQVMRAGLFAKHIHPVMTIGHAVSGHGRNMHLGQCAEICPVIGRAQKQAENNIGCPISSTRESSCLLQQPG